MEPIVSPETIYLLTVCNSIKGIAGAVAIILGIALIGIFITAIVAKHMNSAWNYADVEKEQKKRKSLADSMEIIAKQCLVIFLILLTIAIFVPSKKTMIAMYVADKITTNNLEAIVDGGAAVKNELKADIIEIIEAILKAGEKGPEKSE